ncbi:hypothetical protein K438DRAFT_1851988 [Mycena galopus ATCC 62051]|nr:hypothetical protein K438DRAFT_1851988 [Mycena galopus ATCC 62051]
MDKMGSRGSLLTRDAQRRGRTESSRDAGSLNSPPQTDGPSSESTRMARRERKDLHQAARRARKWEQRLGRTGSMVGRQESRFERQVADADLQEHWATDRILWLDADMDREIQGIALAEGDEPGLKDEDR